MLLSTQVRATDVLAQEGLFSSAAIGVVHLGEALEVTT